MRHPDRRVIRSGAVTLEAVIVLPVFLLMVLGTIDVGMAVFRYNTLSQAARLGARQAIVHGKEASLTGVWGPTAINEPVTSTSVPIVAAVAPTLANCPPGETRVQVTWTAGQNKIGDPVRVTVTSEYTPMLSWIIGGATIDLSASSTMLIAH